MFQIVLRQKNKKMDKKINQIFLRRKNVECIMYLRCNSASRTIKSLTGSRFVSEIKKDPFFIITSNKNKNENKIKINIRIKIRIKLTKIR